MENTSAEPRDISARCFDHYLGLIATVYVVFKIASVVPVSAFGMPFGVQRPFFPGLNAPVDRVAAYFGTHSHEVLISAFLQFGTAIPFGIFTAAVASRLWPLSNSPMSIAIASGGGFMAAVDEGLSGAILWVMGHSLIGQVPVLAQTFHYLAVIFGGPGFTMPQGLLMAGISLPCASMKLLPRWMVALGLLLAIVGGLSWLSMMFPRAGILIPLARWPGFLWLIAVGFSLPKRLSVQKELI
jgi:hypothetical protein